MLEGLAAIHTFDTARENACLRVVKTVRWTADIILLLCCGDVERNPGPTLSCAQWSCNGLSESKELALAHFLKESSTQVCILQETHFSSISCSSFGITGYQHDGFSREDRYVHALSSTAADGLR